MQVAEKNRLKTASPIMVKRLKEHLEVREAHYRFGQRRATVAPVLALKTEEEFLAAHGYHT